MWRLSIFVAEQSKFVYARIGRTRKCENRIKNDRIRIRFIEKSELEEQRSLKALDARSGSYGLRKACWKGSLKVKLWIRVKKKDEKTEISKK